MADRTQLPVACSLSESDLAKRRAGLFADLARRRHETHWLPEGVALRYSSQQGTLALLGEFIKLESECCPFLRFQLTVEPGGEPIRLVLTGPPGTREFLVHEIGDSGRLTSPLKKETR
jgi:hypothetical protein